MTNLEVPTEDDANNESSEVRVPCSLCGRKFLSERLDKHLQVCAKLKEKKRKQFDSVKQRAENLDKINNYPTEIAIVANVELAESPPKHGTNPKAKTNKTTKNSTAKVSETKPPQSNESSKKSNWRAKHEEFLRTIRAARGEEVPPAEPEEHADGSRSKSLPPGMVECPTCARRFSERASDRHISWCAEKQQQEQMKKRNHSKGSNQDAMERMKARTKYKPPTLGTTPPGARSRSNSKSDSLQSTRVGSTSSRQSEASQASSTASNITRKYTRNISKSTESLANKARTQQPTAAAAKIAKPVTRPAARTPTNKTTTTTRTTESESSRLHREGSNRTLVIRRTGGGGGGSSGNMNTIQAKINTGLSSPKKDASSPTKPAVPVMKFKEKFPNHQHQRRINSSEIDGEILRRNSSAYDDSPKTVPGVRTGGISPAKSNSGGGTKSSLSKSEVNLHKIGGDIKQRIDMYISGLHDNKLLSHYADNVRGFMDEHFHGKEQTKDGRVAVPVESRARPHSINSDEARGSTSDSTDSGLGVYTNGNAHESILLDKSHHSAGTYPTGPMVSPPMSELERHSRLLLRNGSLNDIHLLGQGMPLSDEHHGMDEPHYYEDAHDEATNELMTPRFCHQCGTKYPNTLAKFCYQCGHRRSVTVS